MACGAVPTTRSHLIAETLRREFPRFSKAMDVSVRPGADRQTRISTQSRNRDVAAIWVRALCRACNGGWMNRLEKRAAPLLAAMVRREVVVVDAPAQAAIADWATTVGMLRGYVDPLLPRLAEDERYALRRHGSSALPVDVWLVHTVIDGRFRHATALDTSYIATPDPGTGGSVTVLWLGPVAVVVRFGDARAWRSRRLGVAPGSAVRIHPGSSAVVTWPPRGAVEDFQLWRAVGVADRDLVQAMDRAQWLPGRVERQVVAVTPGVDDGATLKRRLEQGTSAFAEIELPGSRRFVTVVVDHDAAGDL